MNTLTLAASDNFTVALTKGEAVVYVTEANTREYSNLRTTATELLQYIANVLTKTNCTYCIRSTSQTLTYAGTSTSAPVFCEYEDPNKVSLKVDDPDADQKGLYVDLYLVEGTLEDLYAIFAPDETE